MHAVFPEPEYQIRGALKMSTKSDSALPARLETRSSDGDARQACQGVPLALASMRATSSSYDERWIT